MNPFKITLNRKKIRKNIPYLFVLIAFSALVTVRVWQQTSAQQAAADPAVSQEEQAKVEPEFNARISVFPVVDIQTAELDKKHEPFVAAGTITGDGVQNAPAMPDVAGFGSQPVHLVFKISAYDSLTAAQTVSVIRGAIKEWQDAGYRIMSVGIDAGQAKPDLAAMDKTLAALRQGLHLPVTALISRAWVSDTTAGGNTARAFADIGKSVAFYIYDAAEATGQDESLPGVIRILDSFRLPFMVMVDKKPELLDLRKQIRDTTYFSGLIIGNTRTAPAKDQK